MMRIQRCGSNHRGFPAVAAFPASSANVPTQEEWRFPAWPTLPRCPAPGAQSAVEARRSQAVLGRRPAGQPLRPACASSKNAFPDLVGDDHFRESNHVRFPATRRTDFTFYIR